MTATPQQRLTWRGVDFSGFGAEVSRLLIAHFGYHWFNRRHAHQFEYWISSIWNAFHHDELIGFVTDQQNTELDYIFDLADMFCHRPEKEE